MGEAERGGGGGGERAKDMHWCWTLCVDVLYF